MQWMYNILIFYDIYLVLGFLIYFEIDIFFIGNNDNQYKVIYEDLELFYKFFFFLFVEIQFLLNDKWVQNLV